jgi:LPXTG-motif cell wall-anchored protein
MEVENSEMFQSLFIGLLILTSIALLTIKKKKLSQSLL